MFLSIGSVRIRSQARFALLPPHPASRILIYLLAALAIPGLPFFWMAILLILVLPPLMLRQGNPLRLIWRTRWLLLVLLFGYAYSLPGEPLWSALAEYSPSREGFRHGLEQAARLVILLLWLDLLVLRLPAEALLAGLYQLFRPFSRIGLDPQRAALRLGLTLRAIEGLERGKGNLRSLLDADFQVDLPSQVTLCLTPWRWTDIALPAMLGLGLLAMWLLAA